MLRLLDEVTWEGTTSRAVTSERSQALLAALTSAGGRAVAEATLATAVWGLDERPANAGKALQVVVSRTRTALGPEAVTRTDGGYRLGLGDEEVDALQLGRHVRDAVRAEAAGDLMGASELARAALAFTVAGDGNAPDVLEEVRADARVQQVAATGVLGRAASVLGDHAEAFALLEALAGAHPVDEQTLAALLRSEAAVHGAPAALARYERHRDHVRHELGVDPGPHLQALHAELLAADNPVRTGLGFDATSLVGRDDDLRRLRALVRESRVTSILGPGGLGKTRLARLLGREAEQPIVHFVELVGVTSPDDVVGEVGSALGVRDSLSGRKVLTAEQRADVRGRLVQQLDLAPTLLILDNCEHVIEAVADLVAPLVAGTRRLCVVTTTRSPLGIAAERIFALDQLSDDAAADLFGQRARAARPDVRLDPDAVQRVVGRLDGLPLAIELAAAKVRAMSVDDIDRRLHDRFALLRGRDPGAPDRHQTLLAVIDWSWALLGEAERVALRRLSVFQDGFSLDAAESVLGSGALGSVESLAGQSLLAVREGSAGLRYRMLETVREFGALRLRAAGEEADARRAARDWCVDFCIRHLPRLYGPEQVATVTAIGVEENNLADVLRECLADGDGAPAMALLAALGGFWTIRGDHARIVVLFGAVEELLEHWQPSHDVPGEVDVASRAAGIIVMNTSIAELPTPERCRALLDREGPVSSDAGTRALQAASAALAGDPMVFGAEALDALVESPDRHIAMLALQWKSHHLENEGDAERAMATAERALTLWRPDDGVWGRALLDTHLAGLHAMLGRLDLARRHAERGLVVLDALGALDDAIQLRAVLAAASIAEGDLERAEQIVGEMSRVTARGLWGGAIVLGATRAELSLAHGRLAEGLALYEQAVVQARELRFPGFELEAGYEPWTLYIEAAATAAHAWHGNGDGDGDGGIELRALLAAKLPDVLTGVHTRIDYPVAGSLCFALGVWSLTREADAEQGVRMLALALRFGYARHATSMRWDRARTAAEDIAPGALDRLLASYGERRGADLLEEARTAAGALS